jgi:hypothetical protein
MTSTARQFFLIERQEADTMAESQFFSSLKMRNGTFKLTQPSRFAALQSEIGSVIAERDRGQGLDGGSMKFGAVGDNLMASFHYGLEELEPEIHQRNGVTADNGNPAPAPGSLECGRANRSAHRVTAFNTGAGCARQFTGDPALERLNSWNPRTLLCRSQERCT